MHMKDAAYDPETARWKGWLLVQDNLARTAESADDGYSGYVCLETTTGPRARSFLKSSSIVGRS